MQEDKSKARRIKRIGLALDRLANRRKRPGEVKWDINRAQELAGIVDTMIPSFNFMGAGQGVLFETEKRLRRWTRVDKGHGQPGHIVAARHPDLKHIQYIQPTAGDRELAQAIIALNGMAMLINVFRAVSDLEWCRQYYSWEIAERISNPIDSIPLSKMIANRAALRKLSFGNDIIAIIDAYEHFDEVLSCRDNVPYTTLRPLSKNGQVIAIASRLLFEVLELGGAKNVGLCHGCWRLMYIDHYDKQYCSSECRAAPINEEKRLLSNIKVVNHILSAFAIQLRLSEPVKRGPSLPQRHSFLPHSKDDSPFDLIRTLCRSLSSCLFPTEEIISKPSFKIHSDII